MPDWKRSLGRPPKTWLKVKQITVDVDTTAADALQLATDRPTWRAANGDDETQRQTSAVA